MGEAAVATAPQSPVTVTRPVRTIGRIDRATFEAEIMPAGQPVLMKGQVADWPIVAAARRSTADLAAALRALDHGEPIGILRAHPGNGGFYFYDARDMGRFNFDRGQGTLSQGVDLLLAAGGQAPPPHLYVGPSPGEAGTRDFMARNPLGILDRSIRARLWLSNGSRVALHYDVSRNVACCVAGPRRFILIPPDQVGNVYLGPFEHTMAGPQVSMVDFHAPDFERFPRFREALDHATVAEMEPGDALYVPTLWWHHVESFGDFNLLVNHWWKPAGAGADFEALMIAIQGLRDQPAPERVAWRAFFDHVVFDDAAPHATDHLPPRFRTITGPASPQRDAMLLRFVIAQLRDRLG
jgi:hypothetical protein